MEYQILGLLLAIWILLSGVGIYIKYFNPTFLCQRFGLHVIPKNVSKKIIRFECCRCGKEVTR